MQEKFSRSVLFDKAESRIKKLRSFFMTAKFSNPLDSIKIASLCSQDWDAMIGSERKRYCGECKLNVYNLSGMSRTEAENLIANSEVHLCVRFYRRADGSVLTQDCPVGWRAVKVKMTKMATAFASLIFGLIGGLGLNASLKNSEHRTMGTITPQISNSNTKSPEILMGEMDVPPGNYATMGNLALPPKQKIGNEGQWEVGGKSAPTMGKPVSKSSPQM